MKICIGLVIPVFGGPPGQSVLGGFFILVNDDICSHGAIVDIITEGFVLGCYLICSE